MAGGPVHVGPVHVGPIHVGPVHVGPIHVGIVPHTHWDREYSWHLADLRLRVENGH